MRIGGAVARRVSRVARHCHSSKPGKYIEPAQEWMSTTRGMAEITLVHETVPGHHLQIALARELPQSSNIAKLADNSAYIEGWSREKAVAYRVATGRFDERGAEATVDRIATLPGQLTAYDSGDLEIFVLRNEAEGALGSRSFHSD